MLPNSGESRDVISRCQSRDVDSTWSQTLAKYGEYGLLENVFSAVRNGVVRNKC